MRLLLEGTLLEASPKEVPDIIQLLRDKGYRRHRKARGAHWRLYTPDLETCVFERWVGKGYFDSRVLKDLPEEIQLSLRESVLNERNSDVSI